jgi:hypothetical protein
MPKFIIYFSAKGQEKSKMPVPSVVRKQQYADLLVPILVLRKFFVNLQGQAANLLKQNFNLRQPITVLRLQVTVWRSQTTVLFAQNEILHLILSRFCKKEAKIKG